MKFLAAVTPPSIYQNAFSQKYSQQNPFIKNLGGNQKLDITHSKTCKNWYKKIIISSIILIVRVKNILVPDNNVINGFQLLSSHMQFMNN